MATVYPNDDEIKFRKNIYGDVKDILNSEVKCTICNDDLLPEIISKKMIMVHQSHLFLCCYNCFYKLCEGNKYSCILCKSNKDLSNCIKCNFNVCNRCVENQNIDKVSIGVLNECFNCAPTILWKKRALAANVLKLFYSQLCLPNGLLVNETDHEQAVRKYLVKEAKIGNNSAIDNIKNHLCINFILKSYMNSIVRELSTFSCDDSFPIDKNLNGFINTCELVLEKTCSTLTNLKRIFNVNSHLSPGVSAIMKSLLKPIDEDENMLVDNTILDENLSKKTKKNKANQPSKELKKFTTRRLRSVKKQKKDTDNLNSTISLSSPRKLKPTLSSPSVPLISNTMNTNLSVVLERLDDSIISSLISNKSSNKVEHDLEKDEIAHPLSLFDSSDSDKSKNTRTLRNRTLKKTNKTKNSTKNQKILDEKSEDEKENDRLTNLNRIEKCSKNKVVIDNEDSSDDTDTTPAKNTSLKPSSKISTNEANKLENINQFLSTIDGTNSDTDNDFPNEENSLESVKGIFTEIKNSVGIPQINIEDNSGDNSDDSSIDDVINSCLTACNKRSIDHYLKKSQSHINNMETIIESDRLENEDVLSDISDLHNNTTIVTRSKKLSPFKLSSSDSDSDSDFNGKTKTKGKKRKLLTSHSSKDSDSSSKFFKNAQKKKMKNDNNKSSFLDLNSNKGSSSISSSNEDSSPIHVKKRRRIRQISDEESEEASNSDKSDSSQNHQVSKKGRKNIRKMKKKEQLSELTQSALKEEELRKKRIEKRQKEYNKLCNPPTPMESCKKLVLDFNEETLEELVTVHPDLVKFLKPHQVKGVTFLWNSVFESLARIKEHKGNGSILAHCMGLGKTLQVITLVHTLFRYPETGIKTVLVITPNATIENWCREFHKWLKNIDEEQNFLVLNFSDSKTYEGRKNIVDEWKREHGVLVTSYQLFRSVVNYKFIDKFPSISEGLVNPGPDLVICDEGHILKNHSTATSKAVNCIKSLRRIVLTGTPLQNNLREYHCMVDFIRPNLLGSIKDFTNRFINPITNGQYSDSTAMDVRIMKRRSHVLHRMLEGFVQRFDYSVLTPFLPPKHEYVIYLRMADKQIELYQKYLDEYRQPELFSNYHMLQMVWTHPKLLALYLKRIETKQEKQKLKDAESRFVNGESSDDDNSNSVDEVEIPGLDLANTKNPDTHYLDWWKPLVSKAELESVYPYSKFIMMFSILQECESIGDKVLLFSQSLFTLDLIQDFLENAEDLVDDKAGPFGRSWDHGLDFYRIDGSVSSKTREEFCERFNDVENTRMRLLLLSTKAFNLGINLVGANRVIIFDVTWNPSLNVQSIFRVFRFGQTKPCYIYRLIAEGTMEQKIYERQISKLSTAFRVVDEHQIDRHFNLKCQEELYEFEPNTTKEKPTLNLPKDRLMAELILKHKDLVMDILEHDSLLQNNEAEELDENDRNAAWEDYEKERDGIPTNNINLTSIQNLNLGSLPAYRSNDDLTLFNTLREFFPNASMLQLNEMLIKVQNAQNVEQ